MRSCRYGPYNGCATIRQRRSGIGGVSLRSVATASVIQRYRSSESGLASTGDAEASLDHQHTDRNVPVANCRIEFGRDRIGLHSSRCWCCRSNLMTDARKILRRPRSPRLARDYFFAKYPASAPRRNSDTSSRQHQLNMEPEIRYEMAHQQRIILERRYRHRSLQADSTERASSIPRNVGNRVS